MFTHTALIFGISGSWLVQLLYYQMNRILKFSAHYKNGRSFRNSWSGKIRWLLSFWVSYIVVNMDMSLTVHCNFILYWHNAFGLPIKRPFETWIPLISKKVMSLSSILATLIEPPVLLRNSWLFHGFSPISLEEHCTSVTCIPS